MISSPIIIKNDFIVFVAIHNINYPYVYVQFYLKRWRSLARFGLMHVVATNMNVWLRYLVIEITESVHHTSAHHDDKSDYGK